MAQQNIPRPLHPHMPPNTGDGTESPKWDDVIQAINQMMTDLYGGVPVASAGLNTNTATGSMTIPAANLAGGIHSIDLAMTGTLGGAANAQLPTVAALVAAIGANFKVGMSYRFRITNQSSGAFAWTVTTNTGWTLAGTMSIPQNTWREFVVSFQSATAAKFQSVAVGTYN